MIHNDYNAIEYKEYLGITKEMWKALFLNEDIINDSNKELILKMYSMPKYRATGTQLTNDENKNPSSYNSKVANLGKRIANYLNIEAPRRKDPSKYRYWYVVFLGTTEEETGDFQWILRPELIDALDELIAEDKLSNIKTESSLPEEIIKNNTNNLIEGATKQITINAYERNIKARNECINYYKNLNNDKIVCQICGFNFGDFYDYAFKDKIHVHHIIPLNKINKEYKVNPKEDLIPICPNCHLVIHSKKDEYRPEEVKKMIKEKRLY